ncbi:MAG: hypothetical protein JNN03_08505 [Rubrivivax sp.]|nr:hypothetical protein [Rubrivivax sp.]
MQHPRRTRLAPLVIALPAWLGLAAEGFAAGKDMQWLVGKPLSGARSTLLADGWLPQETALTTAKGVPERSRGEAGTLLEAGYPEVERCTGSSRNYCFFNYSRRGQCLRVRTLGVLRPPDSEPKVHGAGDACPSKQGKR